MNSESVFVTKNVRTVCPIGLKEQVTIRPLAAGEIDQVWYRPERTYNSIFSGIFGGKPVMGRAAHKVRDDTKIVSICVVHICGQTESVEDYANVLITNATKLLADEIWEISRVDILHKDARQTVEATTVQSAKRLPDTEQQNES